MQAPRIPFRGFPRAATIDAEEAIHLPTQSVLSRALDAAVEAARRAGDIEGRFSSPRWSAPRSTGPTPLPTRKPKRPFARCCSPRSPNGGTAGERRRRTWIHRRILDTSGSSIPMTDVDVSSWTAGLGHVDRITARFGAVLGVVYAFLYPDDDGDLIVWAEGVTPCPFATVSQSPIHPTGRIRSIGTPSFCIARSR